jgi:Protein of unknown function (DUF1647)
MLDFFSNLQLRQLCGVVYRKFNYSIYPEHVRNLTTYAFKPLVIHVSTEQLVTAIVALFVKIVTLEMCASVMSRQID